MIRTALLISLLSPSLTLAQIDHRTNRGNQTAGQSKDANPQIGSGGYNLTRPGLFDAGTGANAVVTGNVTGLAGFRGFSPIPQATAFREILPSSEFTGFFARSVGVNELPTLGDPRPTLFLPRPQTATDAGYVRSSLVPQTNLGTTNLAGLRGYNTALQSRPIQTPITNPTDRRIQGPAEVENFGLRQEALGRPGSTPARSASLFNSAISSPIFGLQPAASVGTRKDLRMMPGENVYEAIRGMESVDPAEDPLAQFDTRRAGQNNPFASDRPEQKGLNNPYATPTGRAQPGRGDAAREIGVTQRPIGASITTAQPLAPANLGADRFADLYNAVRIAESAGVTQLGFRPAEKPPAPEPPTAEEPAVPQVVSPVPAREALVRNSREAIDKIAAQHKWAGDALEDPLTTFAGKYQNELNIYIMRGEELLRQGKFYQASRQFELAATIDPRNPLPHLGLGHSLVAAGDYASGLRAILKGVELFPQITAFRIDLPAMVGYQDIFDRRRADLATRLERAEDPQLRFLLGYLELYSGLSAEGFADLEKAARSSPPESMIARFFEMVSGKGDLPPVGEE